MYNKLVNEYGRVRDDDATLDHALNLYVEEVQPVNDSKNILTSKTAWVFVILLLVGILKATGVLDLELKDSEAEGLALGVVAIIGLILRYLSSQKVHILPVGNKHFTGYGARKQK
jgi:hypothetical protein